MNGGERLNGRIAECPGIVMGVFNHERPARCDHEAAERMLDWRIEGNAFGKPARAYRRRSFVVDERDDPSRRAAYGQGKLNQSVKGVFGAHAGDAGPLERSESFDDSYCGFPFDGVDEHAPAASLTASRSVP
jgi:hypothetical protein